MPLKQYIFDFSKDGDYLRDKVKVGSLEYKMTARGAALDEDMRWTTLGESRAAGKAVLWAACAAGDAYDAGDFEGWRARRRSGAAGGGDDDFDYGDYYALTDLCTLGGRPNLKEGRKEGRIRQHDVYGGWMDG